MVCEGKNVGPAKLGRTIGDSERVKLTKTMNNGGENTITDNLNPIRQWQHPPESSDRRKVLRARRRLAGGQPHLRVDPRFSEQ
jgi:hypothetical protein